MPRKEFEAFTRLDASDVNTYLMDQSVMSFAGTAARGSAIATPVEGMAAYLEDSDILSIYDGSAWKPSLATAGGILQVITGTTTTPVSNSTSTYADTGLAATITPKSAASTILILVTLGACFINADGANSMKLRLVRPDNSTVVFSSQIGFTGTNFNQLQSVAHTSTYSPNATSAQAFKVQFGNNRNGAGVTVQNDNNPSTMTLIEVSQ
jgi:hypothetical protein